MFKKDADEKGFAQYDELDEYYGEADEYSRPDKPEGNCPKWCMRCPTEKVSGAFEGHLWIYEYLQNNKGYKVYFIYLVKVILGTKGN